MEKQWIDNLRKRFADKKAPVPEDLWDGIESAMAGMDITGGEPVRKSRARTISIWGRWTAAAVACVAAVVGVVKYGGLDSSEVDNSAKLARNVADVSSDKSLSKNSTAYDADGGVDNVSENKSLLSGVKSILTDVVDEARRHSVSDMPDVENMVAAESETSPDRMHNDSIEDIQKKNVSVVNRPSESRSTKYYTLDDGDMLASANYHKDMNVSVGLYGTNLMSVGSPSNGGGLIMPMNVYSSSAMNKDLAFLTIRSRLNMADAANTEVKVKHRQPVRVGMSVRFELTDRLGVETGMSYSYLSSDIASGDEDGGFRTEQKLHYVGVPLGLNYGIWKTDFLEIYASAGAMAEFCVSGNTATEYVSGETVVSRTQDDLRDSRPQWSVNAAAGAQYNFNDVIGIYVEPGVSYYFNNGSSVTTIYKDKPFNFNLNLGLRFTVR